MKARLAELHTETLDLADAKAFANEAVDVHVAHGHLPSSLARRQPNLVHNLGRDERQRLSGASAGIVEMPVAFQPLTRHRPYRLDRPQRGLTGGREMNGLHWHTPIMHVGTHRRKPRTVEIAEHCRAAPAMG